MKKSWALASVIFLCGCFGSSSSINKTPVDNIIYTDSSSISQPMDSTENSPKLNIVENQRYEDIIVEQLKEMLDRKERVVIIDLRSPEEYANSRVIGAINIPYADISSKASGIIGCKCRSVVVYSNDTEESGKSAEVLVKMGYRHTRNLWGGFGAWKRDGGKTDEGIKKELQ